MSPVSVAPVQTGDLDLDIPKITYPKESVNEDPAVDSDKDKSKLDSELMSPLSVAPVQTVDLDLDNPKIQSE